MPAAGLHRRVHEIGTSAGAETVAAALFDYRHATAWAYHGGEWFHAASTIKVPVLLGVFDAVQQGRFKADSLVHVRNRFIGAADGLPYRVQASRDANSEVQAAVGRTLRVRELARHMIVTSSNLATNVLIDLVGLDAIGATLKRLGLDQGIELVRGVEDEVAWEQGMNNRVTADGLLGAFRALQTPTSFSEPIREEMMDILHGQRFTSGIPAGLPDDARVAHKTGEISTVAHDAGIVFLPGREPYVVVVLTRWPTDASGRKDVIARISRELYEFVVEGDETDSGEEA